MTNPKPFSWRAGTVKVPTTKPTPVKLVPISGDETQEKGYQLAMLRQLHVQNRYSLGAPTMEFNVVRSADPTLRAGDWRILDLSWFPDYVTSRRGLLTLVQVVALGDLDCAWRHLVVEQVSPFEGGS